MYRFRGTQALTSSRVGRTDVQALNARRAWIVDQLAALIRNGAIPKDDRWVQTILDWFAVHGLFAIRKKSEKARFSAVRVSWRHDRAPRRPY